MRLSSISSLGTYDDFGTVNYNSIFWEKTLSNIVMLSSATTLFHNCNYSKFLRITLSA